MTMERKRRFSYREGVSFMYEKGGLPNTYLLLEYSYNCLQKSNEQPEIGMRCECERKRDRCRRRTE